MQLKWINSGREIQGQSNFWPKMQPLGGPTAQVSKNPLAKRTEVRSSEEQPSKASKQCHTRTNQSPQNVELAAEAATHYIDVTAKCKSAELCAPTGHCPESPESWDLSNHSSNAFCLSSCQRVHLAKSIGLQNRAKHISEDEADKRGCHSSQKGLTRRGWMTQVHFWDQSPKMTQVTLSMSQTESEIKEFRLLPMSGKKKEQTYICWRLPVGAIHVEIESVPPWQTKRW